MAQYRTVEGEGSATANTLTALTTFGAATAVGPVKVPAGASKITEIWVVIGADVDTAGDVVAHYLTLSGQGIKGSAVNLALAGLGGGVTYTGNVLTMAYPLGAGGKVDIDVTANESITVEHQYTGDTTGAATIGVTFKFE